LIVPLSLVAFTALVRRLLAVILRSEATKNLPWAEEHKPKHENS
jgi:hypothetical protein